MYIFTIDDYMDADNCDYENCKPEGLKFWLG
jgi:hypothetical protein